MSDTFFENIPDGSKVYFRPVGAIGPAQSDDRSSILMVATGLRCGGGIVYRRCNGHKVSSQYMSISTLRAEMKTCPDYIKRQLEKQFSALATSIIPLEIPDRDPVRFTKPLVMGVLNVTPDSFSDGGQYDDVHKAIRRGRQMIAEGADIIDIGGESTRPGAKPVWEGDEAARVMPVIEGLAGEGALISIDTRNASVMEKAIKAGAHIINDVSALSHDPDSMHFAAKSNAPVILMHAQGEPQTMQDNPEYDHVLLDVYDYLAERIEACVAAGIKRTNIIVDPGIGFGKHVVKDNIALMNGLSLFLTLGCPVLLGASRKRFIGAITGAEEASDRLIGSVNAAIKGASQGMHIVRVHDVAETVEAMKMVQAFRDGESMDGIPL